MKETLEQALKTIAGELGIPEVSFSVEHPKEIAHGDYATNLPLVAAKQLEKSPKEIAEAVKEKLVALQLPEVASVAVAGAGFVNVVLSKKFFSDSITAITSDKEFGVAKQFAGKRFVVEYASPNPNKAMHLGHLRNVLTGIALSNILEANGATVIREMVDNNRGIAIAKLMWGYLVGARKDGTRVEDIAYWEEHQDEWLTPAEAGKTPDQFIDELYVLGAAESENLESEGAIRLLVVQWELHDPLVWKLWERVLSYSYEGQRKTLNRLGARFDHVWHEHEHYEKGKQYVTQGVERGIFKTLPDGAVLTDLSAFNIPDTILIKRDGTSLYITQDIALTALKKKTHRADKLLWVIGPEQSLAMQQLFAVCEQLGIGARSEFVHIPYGYMSLKGQGKMSSRKGNVVYIDTVLDEAKEKVKEVMATRAVHDEVTAEQIAHAAVVFGILKAGRMTDIAFDISEALRLEGDTGPYLQYATVRAKAVLAKVGDASPDASPAEAVLSLEKLLYRFPEIVERAGAELAPNLVAEFLVNCASAFNSFYATEQIVGDGSEHQYRQAVTAAFVRVMERGLTLLGIALPEQM